MQGNLGRLVVGNEVLVTKKAGGGGRGKDVTQVQLDFAGQGVQDGEVITLEI